MHIKVLLGKLTISLPLKDLIKNQQETNSFTRYADACSGTGRLALSSQRPIRSFADCQSIEDDLTLVSADSQFSAYPVALLQ
jgi:PIN domain nuclease of toxin-antitoxin system